MRLEGARGLDTVMDECLGVVDRAVFAAFDKVADGILEPGAGRGQRIGQVEHLRKGCVADRKPQLTVVDRQGLLNQVQPGLRKRKVLHGASLGRRRRRRQRAAHRTVLSGGL